MTESQLRKSIVAKDGLLCVALLHDIWEGLPSEIQFDDGETLNVDSYDTAKKVFRERFLWAP